MRLIYEYHQLAPFSVPANEGHRARGDEGCEICLSLSPWSCHVLFASLYLSEKSQLIGRQFSLNSYPVFGIVI